MRKIVPGIYRHFKGAYYRVLYIATYHDFKIKYGTDVLTPDMVVYQRLTEKHDGIPVDSVFYRELDNFASEVDKKKYPLATQKFRFELLQEIKPNVPLNEDILAVVR